MKKTIRKPLNSRVGDVRHLQEVCVFQTGARGAIPSSLPQILAVVLASLLAVPPGILADSWLQEQPAPSRGSSAPLPATSNSPDPTFASATQNSTSTTPNPSPADSPPPPTVSTSGCSALSPPVSKGGLNVDDRHAAERWGDISIAQPKIWQYERVNTYLDGLLRDVEGISVSDLTQLDPNAQNAGAIKFIQSALELGVQYNQAIGVSNATAMQTWQAQYQQQQQQITQYNSNLQQLHDQQNTLTQQIVAQSAIVTNLQQLQASGTTLTTPQANALTNAQQSLANLQTALTSVNSAIASAGAPPALPTAPALQTPTVQGPASGTSMSSTFYGLSDLLGKLPAGIQSELTSALQSPSYPATKRLDSFITLLYERLSREISALQDDTMRDPDTEAFLLQFDVGLYPASRTKNHMARVEFQLNDRQCKGCKIYSIYPGQSSYNVANYTGESRRKSFWGNLSFLIGLGVSGAYSRQEDTLHGSLVQSVYTSGFQDISDQSTEGAVQRFGWNYGAAPFEMYVSPGIRSTFAILTVPRKLIEERQQSARGDNPPQAGCFALNVEANWSLRNNPFYNHAHFLESDASIDSDRKSTVRKTLTIRLPGTAGSPKLATTIKREPQKLHVMSFEYNTVYTTPPPSSGGTTASLTPASTTVASPPPSSGAGTATLANGCRVKQCAEVLIGLDQPIDPNLVVTVNGTVLERVRDWRGRATSILPPAESLSDLTSSSGLTGGVGSQGSLRSLTRTAPGLLEADQIGPDTWYALDSHRLLLVISNTTVPDEEFPTIRITDPSKKVISLPQDLDEGFSELLINGFHLAAREGVQFDQFLRNRYYVKADAAEADAEKKQGLTNAIEALKPGGPYSHDTFVPLFLREPGRKRFWASIGETDAQLLIGFLGDPSDGGSRYSWLASRTQVILEDRDLDLAWSLSCYPQGAELVCDLPMPEIQAAYNIASIGCGRSETRNCPAISGSLTDGFVSTLQAWLEQYDPDGDNAFYSPAPVSLGLFPTGEDLKGFLPWQAVEIDSEAIKLEGCQYLTKAGGIDILGERARASNSALTFTLLEDSQFKNCGVFNLPTAALSHDPLVFRSTQDRYSSKPPYTLPASLLRPSFEKPMVVPGDFSPKDNYRPMKWTITIPVSRVNCDDSISSYEGPSPRFKWLAGSKAGGHCVDFQKDWGANFDKTWQSASLNGRVQMQFAVARADVPSLAPTNYIVRGTESTQVATLPSLRHLILPSKLKVQQLSVTQFALIGENADAIAAVAMQSGSSAQILPSASASNYALVTLPQPGDNSKAPSSSSPQITSLLPPSGVAGVSVTIKGANFGAQQDKNAVTFDGQNAQVTKWSATSIVAKVPSGAKTGDVAVTVSGVASNSVKFAIGSAPIGPKITALSPPLGPSNTSVTISGSNFGPKQNTSSVTFEGKSAQVTKWAATSISAKVPAGATTGKVIVTVSGASSNPLTFTLELPANAPQITSLAPSSGPVGASVTIKGANFGPQQNKASVTFDGKPAQVTKWTATSISTRVPTAGTTGDFVVTVSGVASNGVTFTLGSVSTPTSAKTATTMKGGTSVSALAPGTYALTPLFFVGADPKNPYMPIEATDDQGKPLTITIAAPPKSSSAGEDSGNGTTTTIKITESADSSQQPSGSTAPVSTPTKPQSP
jgi:IPT/TIG domain-containing protein